jgi:hypothetical protein
MEGPETAIFRRVDVVRDIGTAFLCSVGRKQVWVPLTEIRYGTNLTKKGDHGTLIISRWLAGRLGLR